MRRIISLSVILILSFFCVVPQSAQASPWNARDYFRDGSNYDAYSMGQGRIHYKVLIFAEGNGHNNNAGNGGAGSRIWTRTSGSSTYPNFIHYYSDNSNCKPGVVSGRPRDKGWVRIKVEEGIVVVTNAYNGDNPVFTADNQWHDVDVRRNDVGDHLTYLEFDWYVPSYLTGNNISFVSGVESVYHESGGSTYEHRQFILGNFNSGGGDQQPQLVNPIFYTANGIGTAGYGMLAVPYVSFQQTYQYYTAWNPARIPCHEQSGMIYVPSCDSVQHGFYINMETRSSQSTSTVETKQWLKSSKVNIPAYHRIYDMNWSPYYYLDEESGLYISDYRYRKITWKLKLPYEEDIVPNDAFEIQRAYRSDYSDAQTIATIPIEWARDSVADSTYEYLGHVVISDEIKPSSADAIRAMKQNGVVKTVMLTGDIASMADSVAKEVGIDEVYSELLPEDKVTHVEKLIEEKNAAAGSKASLAFVGDGINDAPVLAIADIGIAMGALGSDAAIEAADVVLMDDDPMGIVKAIRIARKCIRIVYENIYFAIGVKILCLILGALGIANMWLAIFADVGVMVICVLNAVRALFVKKA